MTAGIYRFFLCITAFLSLLLPVRAQEKVDVLVIDPGHGGKDAGCVGKAAREKDIALTVALKFGDLVKKNFPDVKVVYTRSDDRFIELWKRGQIANDNHADLFVSIHCNASKNTSARGTETWIRGSQKDEANLAEVQRENAVILQEQNHESNYSQSWMDVVAATVMQDAGFANSIYFSQELQSLYADRISSTPNRGIKQGPFYVLWKSARPSVLTEIGFLSNPEEERFLRSEEGQDKVANCLLQAFAKYKKRIDSRSGGDDLPTEFLPSVSEVIAGKREAPETEEVPVVERSESEDPTLDRQPSPAPAPDKKPVVVFKVQIAASGNRLDLVPANFKGLSPLSRTYDSEKKLYKYYYAESASHDTIRKELQKAKDAGYSSAFIAAFVDGKSVSVTEALEKLK